MAAALLGLIFALSTAPSYGVAISEESRLGSNHELDLEVVPSFDVQRARGTFQGWARYYPRFLLVRPTSQGAGGILHRLSGEAAVRDRRGNRSSLAGSFAYGRNDFSFFTAAAEGTLPSLDRIELLRNVRYLQADATAAVERQLGRRIGLSASAGYGVSGGVTTADRAALPLFDSARAGVNVAVRANRSDSFTLALSGLWSRVQEQHSHASIVTLGGGWQHKLPHKLAADLQIGTSLVRQSQGASSPIRHLIEPSASAGLAAATSAFDHPLHGTLRVNLSPFVDPLTGSVSLRPDATGQMTFGIARSLSLVGGAAVARAPIRGQRRVVGVGFGELLFLPAQTVRLAAGVRTAAQPDVRWVAFVAFGFMHRAFL